MSANGIFGTPSESLPSMPTDLNFDAMTTHNILLKIINIAVRCIDYTFCKRDKTWINQNLQDY